MDTAIFSSNNCCARVSWVKPFFSQSFKFNCIQFYTGIFSFFHTILFLEFLLHRYYVNFRLKHIIITLPFLAFFEAITT